MPPSDSTNDIIKGSLRTMVQFVPLAGGAVAQAWSEYESIWQKQRTEEFFAQLRENIEALEQQHSDLKQKIESMPDAAELMEISVAAAKRETSEVKRAVFSRIYSNFLASPSRTSPADRLDLIHHVEQLNSTDIGLLQRFAASSGLLRGDMITGTTMPEWETVGGPRERESAWLDRHGPVVHSLAKLEARGLLHDAMLNDGSFSRGSMPNSFDRFRGRAWTITPMGKKLLEALRPISSPAH
jgi:hypothetical protein